jgi:hypothetical protein
MVKRPKVIIFAILLFALAVPNALMQVLHLGPGTNSGQKVVWLVALVLNVGIAIWLWLYPRTARIPTTAALLYKVFGSASALYFSLQGIRLTPLGSDVVVAVLSGSVVVGVSAAFIFGSESRKYFVELQAMPNSSLDADAQARRST